MKSGKKKVQCYWCRAKLSGVFKVCVCKNYFCPRCTNQEKHCCSNLGKPPVLD